jgi:spermidine synthase
VFPSLEKARPLRSVAVVGLGVGAMSSYSRASQNWTYFEIDPAVEHIARDPSFFTFLSSSAAPCRVVLGDARLSLVREPDATFDLLVIDAFGSDAIPLHLLTREALDLYRRKLSPDGVLLFHISNQRYRLEHVLANLAPAAGFRALYRQKSDVTKAEFDAGVFPSRWILLFRRPADAGALTKDPRWTTPAPDPRVGTWTDDYSNILSVVQWR